jgi:hypothetical protein
MKTRACVWVGVLCTNKNKLAAPIEIFFSSARRQHSAIIDPNWILPGCLLGKRLKQQLLLLQLHNCTDVL